MKTLTDQQLLREYALRRSEPAFAELVRRHLDLVHSAAFRMTGERQSAQDVSQAVFLTLAREAGRLAGHPVLSGWLHTTARNVAANHVRSAVRRQIREQEAVSMNELSVTEPDASWARIAPHLDAALGTLSESDRDVVVLRYFEEKSAPEIAAVLGISDDAAAKRVSRAVEKLRGILARRGIAVGASSLAVVISANAVQAAPVGLYSVVSSAVTSGTAMSGTVTAAAAKSMTITTAQKLVMGTVISGIIGLIAYLSLHPRVSGTEAGIPGAKTNGDLAISQTNGSTLDAQASAQSTDPDPVSLLRAVMRARMKIHSGAIEFQYALDRFDSGRKESDQRRFDTLFDGSQLRFESFGHEYAYAYDEDEVKQRAIQKRADGMSHADAVKAGLLEEFSSHHILIRDGEALYDYWEASNQRPRTDISDLARGTGGWLFDPRCVGLTTYLSSQSTVANCLPTKNAEFVGVEEIEGVAAYHVRIKFDGGDSLDYWIDKEQPERLLQHSAGLDIEKSKYDNLNPTDPIPVQVDAVSFRNGVLANTSRLIRTKASYNLSVDSSRFTLAGLDMAVGTEVIDNRIMRMIGYWNGSGLTSDLPKPSDTNAVKAPQLSERLALLQDYPASPEARENAVWVILNTPDGPAVEKAGEVILQAHIRDTNLMPLCVGLERLRPHCASNLLATISEQNPDREIRGNACFMLATIIKSQAGFGTNRAATAQAMKLYERVIREFGQVKQRGYPLAELARPELYELQHLAIGQPAPSTQGVDMDGNPMDLSNYRGQVTVLVFWMGNFLEVNDFRKLQADLAGKPFALIGVNSDENYSIDPASVEKVNWPSFRDERDGPISKLWNSHCWPDIWVLDKRGIIRYRRLRVWDLRPAVEKLLLE